MPKFKKEIRVENTDIAKLQPTICSELKMVMPLTRDDCNNYRESAIYYSSNHFQYSTLPYDDFPVNPSVQSDSTLAEGESSPASALSDEVLFSGQQQKGCVCFVDMMNSTKIVDKLTESQISGYYSLFLNDMAIIIRNFGGKIIKNGGDALLYYFPMETLMDKDALRDVLDCGVTMMAAHEPINTKLITQGLPPLDYRISSDYGMLTIAKSITSQSYDLFGPVVNHCAKINSKAPQNGMAIGDDLYQIIQSSAPSDQDKSFEDYYLFEKIGSYNIGARQNYPLYSVNSKTAKDRILNPFTRVSIRSLKPARATLSTSSSNSHAINKT